MVTKIHKKNQKLQKDKHLNHNDILKTSTQTTEKIDQKNLKNFLKTTIEIKLGSKQNSGKYFYKYFEDSNTYDIYLLKNHENNALVFPFIFSKIHDNRSSQVFIYDNSYTFFSKGEFIFFKNLDSKDKEEDLLNYIKQRHQIQIDTIQRCSLDEIKDIQKQYLDQKNRYGLKLYSLDDYSRLKYFLTFCFITLLIPLLHFNLFLEQNKSFDNSKLKKIESKYQNLIDTNSKKISKKLINTITKIKHSSLTLQSIKLHKNKIYIFLSSTDKLKLISFIQKDNLKINRMFFNKQSNSYNLEAMIEI